MTNIHLIGSPDSKGVATDVFLTVMQLSQEVWADLLKRTAVGHDGAYLMYWQIKCGELASTDAVIKVMMTRQDNKKKFLAFDTELGTSYGHIGTPRVVIAEVEFSLNKGRAGFGSTPEWIDGTEKISAEVVKLLLKTYHTSS